MGDFQEQPQQRGVHRPRVRDQGPLLPAHDGGGGDLPEDALPLGTGHSPAGAAHAGHARAVLRDESPQAARQQHDHRQDAGLRRAEPQGDRPEGQVGAGVPRRGRRGRGHGRDQHPLRLQSALGRLQPRPGRGERRPRAPDAGARPRHPPRAVRPRRGEGVPRLHQGRACAALRGARRRRNPDRLSRSL